LTAIAFSLNILWIKSFPCTVGDHQCVLSQLSKKG